MTKLPTSLTQFCWYFIKKQPIAFFILFIAPTSMVLETNVIPYALKLIIDVIIEHEGNKSTIFYKMVPGLWVGGLAWVAFIVITLLNKWLEAYVIPRFETNIRLTVLDYITYHSYDYFSNQLAGNLANKIADLPKSIESIRMIICWNGISGFSVVLVALIMMATINQVFSWILGLWVIIHLTVTLYCARFVNKFSQENAEDKSILSGVIVDIISNIFSIKLFARHSYELTYASNRQAKEQKSNSRLIIAMNIFQLVIDILVTLMLGSILYFLIISWQQEIISTGNFVLIFNMVFAVMYQILYLGHALTVLFREIGAAQQALMLITYPNEIIDAPDSKPIKITNAEIKFDNITFYYNKGKNVFENKSVIINSCQKVGLVGFSGSGKSTFVNLILRFFDVESGTIKIDGQDITKITQDSLRENITMIPQDTSLFHRTLMENIRYGRICATDEEVIIASKKAHCHDFISQLPNKYDSLVGERGIKLSSGQRQRVAIARAILKDAPILILDEATSALDSMTEHHIQKGLHTLMKGRTTIVIAHRLSTLSEMDRILVFDQGRIVEDGTHEELLRLKGHYKLMWKMQVGGFLPKTKKHT
ncbi:MAG: ABC transporter ATP-binding protein [Alphaproteobacteria bacterium]